MEKEIIIPKCLQPISQAIIHIHNLVVIAASMSMSLFLLAENLKWRVIMSLSGILAIVLFPVFVVLFGLILIIMLIGAINGEVVAH